jgi:2-dehydro-3-deoxyphosphogluconate aldolase/(4S)-4-hydroxy-2-oxoglutarate aldolase
MDSHRSIIERIKEQGLLPLYYNADKDVCIAVAHALYNAGVRIIEFTNRGKMALENFKALKAERDASMKDLMLGIGTIGNAHEANAFMDAGADFLVSPFFEADVADAAYIRKVLWIPGCMTPTEIHHAKNAGCNFIKLFPGNVLEPSFVQAIKELFQGIDMMPTGGVETDKENLTAWFEAGVCAVGMGSKLVSKKLMESKDYETIEKTTRKVLKRIAAIKK